MIDECRSSAINAGRIIKLNHAGEHGAVNMEICITDPASTAAISAILSEEQQHHAQSAARIRHAGLIDRIIGSVISAATEAVIRIGMRI